MTDPRQQAEFLKRALSGDGAADLSALTALDATVDRPLDARQLQAELASQAGEVALASRQSQHRRARLSRAAELNLIDSLSRLGASSLGLLAGLAVFGATYMGRAYPYRAAVWAVLVFAALYLCRRYRFDYRAGKAFAGRPFRWRAHYTSALAVLSAAFGAGAFLLSPALAGPGHALETAIALGAGLAIGSVLHSAHLNSAAATFLPGAGFIIVAAYARLGAGLETGALMIAAMITSVCLVIVSRQTTDRASQRFPRAHMPMRESLIAPRHKEAGSKAGLEPDDIGHGYGQASA